MLSGLGWDIIATDINPEVLKYCQQRVPSAKCILVHPTDTLLPCESGTIDLVVAIEPDVAMQSDWILPEVSRVLSLNGLFVSVIWNNMSWRGLIPHMIASRKKKYDYYTYNYREWKNRFKESGLEFIHVEGMCWMPFSRSSNSPLIPAFTMMEKLLGLRKLTYVSPWVSLIAKKAN